jgi:hypothetical protein
VNKVAVRVHLERWICGAGLLLPAGHGGKGSKHFNTSSSSSRGRFFVKINHAGASLPPWSSTDMDAHLQPLMQRLCESVARARCFFIAKWCVPGDLEVTSYSAATLMIGGTQGLDCFLSFVLGCFLQIRRPYLQIYGFLGRFDVRVFLQIVPATCNWNYWKR